MLSKNNEMSKTVNIPEKSNFKRRLMSFREKKNVPATLIKQKQRRCGRYYSDVILIVYEYLNIVFNGLNEEYVFLPV